ncbi:MAG: phosphotransferase, partial [Actinomycetota bacterium]|nr:phosphotransferase [Actinomycetota bacterium]
MLLGQAAHTGEIGGLLELPWQLPLRDWSADLLVQVRDRGLARHCVRFVETAGALLALKEMPEELVARERRLLAFLAEESVPAVELIGAVTDRGGSGNGILITRYLEFSLPYRTIFSGPLSKQMHERLVDALVELLVRLHLAGFFWGDCSL